VRNMLVKAQREGKTWNRDQRNQFQEDLETALRSDPLRVDFHKERLVPKSDNSNSPGGACYFCGPTYPNTSCTEQCTAELFCNLSQDECWKVQGNYCVKVQYCGFGAAVKAELCYAVCIHTGGKPSGTKHDPHVTAPLPKDQEIKPPKN
jgi:hypothetical protein